ncbi:hypothetical protein GN956_G22846 [Arapaima gigas]
MDTAKGFVRTERQGFGARSCAESLEIKRAFGSFPTQTHDQMPLLTVITLYNTSPFVSPQMTFGKRKPSRLFLSSCE